MTTAAVSEAYELSPTQEGMLYHGLAAVAGGVDLEQIVCAIDGTLKQAAFVAAFQAVIARHAILRTRFAFDAAGRPVQEVLAAAAVPSTAVDASARSAADAEALFAATLREDRARGIDLAVAPAMRLLFFRTAAQTRILWTFHHALLDGRSFPLVLREVFAFYKAGLGGKQPALPLPRPYREYIGFLRGLDTAAAEAYWRKILAGFSAPVPLGIDHPAADDAADGAVQGVAELRLTQQETKGLRDFSARCGVTLNTLLQAAWAIVLSRYSREQDIVYGATRACRRSAFADADAMIGLFINTLPLRLDVDPETTVSAFLRDVRNRQVELRDHEHTPLARIQGWSDVPRGRPLFETILVYENRTLDETMRAHMPPGRKAAFHYHGQTNYPLTVIGYGDDEMLVRLENDRRRVSDDAAARALGHVVSVLRALPQHAEAKLHEVPMLGSAERAALARISVPAASFRDERTLHQRFAALAQAQPEATAATCDGVSLSYRELERRAARVARKLRARGVGPDVLVAIRTERSLSILVGILAILKAGGAYLPLDPAYPKDRALFMLGDSRVGVVVTEAAFAADFESSGLEMVFLDDADANADADAEANAETDAGQDQDDGGAGPDNLAYVIYTSGSTGKPKGVRITHRNVTRLFDATNEWYGFGASDVWTLFHSYAFDFSVWEIWGALLYGGRVVVVPFWVSRSPEAFLELLLRENVTVLNQTPSAFRQLIQVDIASGPVRANALRCVIFGGEALELQSLRPWFERHGDQKPQLVNMYGITETTVHVTYRPIALADLEAGRGSVIGVPIPDLSLSLLDAHGYAVPIGVAGEMYVGGAGVSQGYLGRPELTAQRFVPDPFVGGGAKLYRTGDLARRTEEGELEYLGRADDQVKIRGFRIELGEIEAVLGQHPDVAEAVVVVREESPGDKRLCAYVAGDAGTDLVERLKEHLRGQLPEYMVPAHFVVMKSLPLTQNGKVDRKALPAPDFQRLESARPYIAPRNATEEALATIWAAVLGAPRVSIDDNFFELGGDSILTIQVIARCRQAGLRFTPRDLAKRPTIAQLAEVAGGAEAAAAAAAPADEAVQGAVQPTPIVQWFFERKFANPNHWNQAFLFQVPTDARTSLLRKALGQVVAHHDAFRLRAVAGTRGHSLTHAPAEEASAAVARIDLAGTPAIQRAAVIEAAASVAQASLDIARGPVCAAIHFDLGVEPGRLLIAVHHLAIDGVSWRLVVEDLEAAYEAALAGKVASLPARTASFQSWSRALAAYGASGKPQQALAHWQQVAAVPAALPPLAATDAQDTEGAARTTMVSLDAAETQDLLQRAPAAWRTQINDMLLAALALALRAWSGRGAHRIEIEGHGREEQAIGGPDVSRTVGWFTTLYPVALDIEGANGEIEALRAVKESLRAVPDKGLSYGVMRYGSDAGARAALAAAEPAELLFNYLGQFDQVVAGASHFRFADESTGAWHGAANERTHRVEVVSLVRGGRFEARFIHGSEPAEAAAVARLAADFAAALRSLVAQCTAAGAGGFTPSDFSLARIDQPALDALAARHTGMVALYPLSPMQRLFLSMDEGGHGFEQWLFRLDGAIDAAALRAAWQRTLDRHDVLRTAFAAAAEPEPLQVVQGAATLPWTEADFRGADAQQRLAEFLAADRARGFDVATAPLCRVTLVRMADAEWRLVWSTHHLYVDGWSWPLIFKDVAAFYEGGAPAALAAPCQYGDYIAWLRSEAPESREFWEAALQGFTEPTPLPRDQVASGAAAAAAGASTSSAALRLDAAQAGLLQSAARSLQVTLNSVVQACWALLLGHWSGSDDVVFGAAFSGRPPELPGVETLVGPCVNNLPVRVRLADEPTFDGLLAAVHRGNLDIAQHQYAPLARIQEWAGVPWRLRLFESLVVFQNYIASDAPLRLGGATVEPLVAPDETNYPVTLTATPLAGALQLKLDCHAGFSAAAAAAMLADLGRLLDAVAAEPRAELSALVAGLPAAAKGLAAAAATTPPPAPAAAYAAPASDIERTIAEVWQELFQVERVSRDDNFFDLGGHSILLIQAHARLRERTRPDLSIVALLQYPTIRTLAAHLGNGGKPQAQPDAARDRARLQREALARQRSVQGRR